MIGRRPDPPGPQKGDSDLLSEGRHLIRPYRDDDLEALADLWVQAWVATMPEIDFASRRGWIREELRHASRTGDPTLCAEPAAADDAKPPRLAGFLMLRDRKSHLEQLAVHPAHFARGAGRDLLEAAKRLSPGRLTLAVNQENPRAARFYLREGFVIVSEGLNPGGKRKIWTMQWTRT